MSYVFYGIGWTVLGYFAIAVALIIHWVRAIHKGYDYESEIRPVWDEMEDVDWVKVTWGLVIWPKRIADFIFNIDYLYSKYDERKRQKYPWTRED